MEFLINSDVITMSQIVKKWIDILYYHILSITNAINF